MKLLANDNIYDYDWIFTETALDLECAASTRVSIKRIINYIIWCEFSAGWIPGSFEQNMIL